MKLPVHPIVPDRRHSGLTCLEQCPRKHLLQERYGLRPRGAMEYAPEIGIAFHAVLQAFYEGATPEAAETALLATRDAQKEVLAQLVDQAGFLPNGESLQKIHKTVDEIYWKGLVMGRIFWQTYPLESDKYPTVLDPHGTPMVEPLISMPTTTAQGKVTDTCRVDRLVSDPDTPDGVYIVDHKSTSKNVLLQAQALSLSAQPRHYARIVQRWLDACHSVHHITPFPALKVRGVIFNIMQVPGIKLCNKDNWEFPNYLQRVMEWYAANREEGAPTMIQTKMDFKPGDGPDRQLDHRLDRLADASLHDPTDLDYFWCAGGARCTDFNRPCAYLKLCTSDPATWGMRIEESFVQDFRDKPPLPKPSETTDVDPK